MCTVLVADGDKLTRWSMSDSLESSGFDVLQARSASEALELLHPGVCLALVDYYLPDADGVVLLRAAKGQAPGCRIIVMMYKPSEEVRAAAIGAGAADYFVKPSDLREIAPHVTRVLTSGCRVREQRLSCCRIL